MVLDEAHKAKNTATYTYGNLKKMIAKDSKVIALTGTPLLNNLQEFYTLLELCAGEGIGGGKDTFNEKIIKPIEASLDVSVCPVAHKKGAIAWKKLSDMKDPYMLKRFMKDTSLSTTVPANNPFDVWVKLSSEQRQLYESYLQPENVQKCYIG